MKSWLIAIALVLGFIVAGPGAAAQAAPPVSGEGITLTLRCDVEKGSGFNVEATLSGKLGEIVLSDGTILKSTSPGLKITLTANGKTLNYVITGVTTFTFLDDRIEAVSTGLNLLIIPKPAGLFLTTGNVNYALTLKGKELRTFSGTGTVTDVCALLA